jgi:hypothetical protein
MNPTRVPRRRPAAADLLVAAAVLASGALGFGGSASGVPSSPAQDVTLTLRLFWSNECNCYKARASGRISSGAAGQEVVILKSWCGRSFGTADAATQTHEGGHFDTEVAFVPGPGAIVSANYRARWDGHLSAPVLLRGVLTISGKKLSAQRHQVTVSTQSVNPANLRGRPVFLRRQSGNTWTRVATAKLAPHPVKYYTFVAAFSVPRRGWTLRAVVPAKSAAPCFAVSTSKTWRS